MISIRTGLLIVGLYAAYQAGMLGLKGKSAEPNPKPNSRWSHNGVNPKPMPPVTLGLLLITAVPTTLQFFFPEILEVSERDYAKIVAGQWWRPVTALLVQDAGVAGSLFNLICLLLVGRIAEQRWGGRRLLLVYLAGGLVGEAMACLWQPVGAGNSVANFSVAGSIAIACLSAQPPRLALLSAVVALGADVSLLFLRDIHGAAACAGAFLALVLIRFENRSGSTSI